MQLAPCFCEEQNGLLVARMVRGRWIEKKSNQEIQEMTQRGHPTNRTFSDLSPYTLSMSCKFKSTQVPSGWSGCSFFCKSFSFHQFKKPCIHTTWLFLYYRVIVLKAKRSLLWKWITHIGMLAQRKVWKNPRPASSLLAVGFLFLSPSRVPSVNLVAPAYCIGEEPQVCGGGFNLSIVWSSDLTT